MILVIPSEIIKLTNRYRDLHFAVKKANPCRKMDWAGKTVWFRYWMRLVTNCLFQAAWVDKA